MATFQTALSDVTLKINSGSAIAYVPGTLAYNEGLGENTVKSQSAAVLVNSLNLETLVGKVKFDLMSTKENIADAVTWKGNKTGNAISLSFALPNGTNFTKNFGNMVLINDYEIPLSQEGQFTLEFAGTPST